MDITPNNNNYMITTLTGEDLGQDMFRVASASCTGWDTGTEVLFNGDTSYKDNLFRVLTFTEETSEDSISNVTISLPDYQKYQDQIKGLFSVFSEDIEKIVGFAQTIPAGSTITVIHTRGYEDKEYYDKAIEAIDGQVYIVIADEEDMEWARECIYGDHVYYSPFDDDMLNLILMIGADNLILGKSYISWWGAFLNCREFARVVAPHNDMNIYPDTWITL